MTTQVFSVPLLDKLHRFTLAGHGREIIGVFFELDSLNVSYHLYFVERPYVKFCIEISSDNDDL